MLKKGLAWHYKAYDKRAELDKVIIVLSLLIGSFSFILDLKRQGNYSFFLLVGCKCSGK